MQKIKIISGLEILSLAQRYHLWVRYNISGPDLVSLSGPEIISLTQRH